MQVLRRELLGEAEMVEFGRALGSAVVNTGAVIFLEGELGMGKTTLCRGVLCACGHRGKVKSPTYTLVEPYEFEHIRVYHFDLYRLGDPEELEYLGVRDYFDSGSLCLVEWAEKGGLFLPPPDIVVRIAAVAGGRVLNVEAQTPRGEQILNRL